MHISRLYCYPIKSCAGIALDSVHVSLRGILHDRAWAVVDLKTKKVLTQRDTPRLCLVRTALDGGELVFSAQDGQEMRTPIEGPESGGERGLVAEIWGDRVDVVDQGVWPSGWFSAFLGKACSLVRMPGARRPKDRDIAFADAYECLVLSEASLDDLNGRLEAPLSMDRFRPNVVVAGCGPYAEDAWHYVRLGGMHAEGQTACVRCVITVTDQRTGVRGKEPLKTLATYRKTEEGVTFGRNFSFLGGGLLSVGDPVVPLAALS